MKAKPTPHEPTAAAQRSHTINRLKEGFISYSDRRTAKLIRDRQSKGVPTTPEQLEFAELVERAS